MALDGDTILVGAHRSDGNVVNSGSAYIFTRSGTRWIQQAKLTASNDGAALDFFSFSVALDGDIALVGTPFDDDGGPSFGSAYVFETLNELGRNTQVLDLWSDGELDPRTLSQELGIPVVQAHIGVVVPEFLDTLIHDSTTLENLEIQFFPDYKFTTKTLKVEKQPEYQQVISGGG